MHILSILIFAHFFADYVLQPNWLARWKKHSLWGILVHVFFIGLVMTIVLIPYLHNRSVWQAVLLITSGHLILDVSKIQLQKKFPGLDDRLMYSLDQLLHLALIAIGAFYVAGEPAIQGISQSVQNWYTNQVLLLFLTALVLVTYVWDITRYVFLQPRSAYMRDHAGMALRAFVLMLIMAFAIIVMR